MLIVLQSQASENRFYVATYKTQLLAVLEECSSLVEKHNRDLIPHFLSLAGPDLSTKLPRYKLSAWLKLFSKFSNPNALRLIETMRALYVSLLSPPDRSLQWLTLSCLLTYKSPRLLPHEDSLRLLLDHTNWRDELTRLDIVQLDADECPELVDVIIRLLYGMMLDEKGRTRSADRCAAVLSSLVGCSDEELTLLVDLMLQTLSNERPVTADGGSFVTRPVPEYVSEKQQVGFLTLLGDLLKHLGSRVVPRWPALLEMVLDLIASAQATLDVHMVRAIDVSAEEELAEGEEEGHEEPTGSVRTLRSIRQLGLKRLADFFRCSVVCDFSPYMPEAFRYRLPSHRNPER